MLQRVRRVRLWPHLLSHGLGLAPGNRTVLAPPGQRRIYSNAGYEWVADLVAERAEMDFSEYLADAVLGPLAMDSARLGPPTRPPRAWSAPSATCSPGR